MEERETIGVVGVEQLAHEDKLHRVYARENGLLEEGVFLVAGTQEIPVWVFISGLSNRLFEPGPLRTVMYFTGQGSAEEVALLAQQLRLADVLRNRPYPRGWSMGRGPIFEGSQSYGLPGTIPRYYQPERSGYDRLLQLLASGAIPSVPGSRTLLVEIVITRRSPLNDPELRAEIALAWLLNQGVQAMIEALHKFEQEQESQRPGPEDEGDKGE